MARFASYVHEGRAGLGLSVPGGFVMLERGRDALLDALAEGRLERMAENAGNVPDVPEEVEFLPPIPVPGRIICIGMNFRDHADEMGAGERSVPGFFLKDCDTLSSHGGKVLRPAASEQLDYEGELAVIIGRRGRAIGEEAALDHIAGYSCFNDGSVRDFQRHSTGAGKNFPATSPLGPFMTTPDEVGDPSQLRLRTRLNGALVQDAPLSRMIFPVATCVSYVSTVMELCPGDVIATGSPAGTAVAKTPPRWLRPGDCVEIDIGPVGVLSATVADAVDGQDAR